MGADNRVSIRLVHRSSVIGSVLVPITDAETEPRKGSLLLLDDNDFGSRAVEYEMQIIGLQARIRSCRIT